jgi:hypothetical protein
LRRAVVVWLRRRIVKTPLGPRFRRADFLSEDEKGEQSLQIQYCSLCRLRLAIVGTHGRLASNISGPGPPFSPGWDAAGRRRDCAGDPFPCPRSVPRRANRPGAVPTGLLARPRRIGAARPICSYRATGPAPRRCAPHGPVVCRDALHVFSRGCRCSDCSHAADATGRSCASPAPDWAAVFDPRPLVSQTVELSERLYAGERI